MAMEDKTNETMPGVNRTEGWKPRRQQKRTLVEAEPKTAPEKKEEEPPRQPDPLPFGKLDILA